jgi:hypothetical protein
VAAAPFTLANSNPTGSDYATNYALSTSDLLAQAIQREIFDSAPAMYNALKLMYSIPFSDENSDEFKYAEKPWNRPTITVFGWNSGTSTLTLAGTYSTLQSMPVVVGDVIVNASDVPFMVQSVTYSNVADSATITVAKQTGGSLAAGDFTAAETVSIQSATIADGMNYFAHYDRANVVWKYNYIQMFQRARRWSEIELLKYQNTGTTNFLDMDKVEAINQLRNDVFATMFDGTRGEFTWTAPTSGTYRAKATGGIYPSMVSAGSAHASPTLSSLKTAFEKLCFSTNYKAEGGVRMVYATDEILYELSKAFKEPGIQYTPNDSIANLGLNEYKIGAGRYVPVTCELFREASLFPAVWKNRILVLDMATIKPTKLKGKPHIEVGQTSNKSQGTREDYVDYWVKAYFGLKFNNPLGSFYIDVK